MKLILKIPSHFDDGIFHLGCFVFSFFFDDVRTNEAVKTKKKKKNNNAPGARQIGWPDCSRPPLNAVQLRPGNPELFRHHQRYNFDGMVSVPPNFEFSCLFKGRDEEYWPDTKPHPCKRFSRKWNGDPIRGAPPAWMRPGGAQ